MKRLASAMGKGMPENGGRNGAKTRNLGYLVKSGGDTIARLAELAKEKKEPEGPRDASAGGRKDIQAAEEAKRLGDRHIVVGVAGPRGLQLRIIPREDAEQLSTILNMC